MPSFEEAGVVVEKKSLIAAEQNRPDVVERRRNFSIASRFVDPGQLIFLDESGAKTNMTRLYGRSPIGERCVDHTPHGHWKTMMMLSAIRLDGVMQEATMVYDGPMNRDTFVTYIEHRLVPALRPGDIVIMDNLSSHKDAKVRELIEAADADLWYLPPYSPDLAPHWTLPSKSCGARSRRGCAASWPTRSTACWTRLPTPCERWAPANVPTISLRVGMEIIDAHCSKRGWLTSMRVYLETRRYRTSTREVACWSIFNPSVASHL